ncbi:hypothetical protein [Sphingomonas jaspsi]|uniref:hypothetical protein n=1 Tax=Sphingomonas jaspsi TaxID=392409 RepID=UPI0004AD17E9|nr:hypothetical protein [Sphingomonas jaspsi]
MNPFEFVLAIIIVVTIGKIVRYRMGDRDAFRRDIRVRGPGIHLLDDRDDHPAETERLKGEVQQLKDRIKVLERIAVEKEDTLSRQIEELRDR